MAAISTSRGVVQFLTEQAAEDGSEVVADFDGPELAGTVPTNLFGVTDGDVVFSHCHPFTSMSAAARTSSIEDTKRTLILFLT